MKAKNKKALGILAIILGVLTLVWPEWLQYFVAGYLIFWGITQLL